MKRSLREIIALEVCSYEDGNSREIADSILQALEQAGFVVVRKADATALPEGPFFPK